MKNEITELQENDIDVSPLVEYKDDHCPPAELSNYEDVPHRDFDVSNGKQISAILDILESWIHTFFALYLPEL